MILPGNAVYVIGKDDEIDSYADMWSDEADDKAREIGGYVIAAESEPMRILADFRSVPDELSEEQRAAVMDAVTRDVVHGHGASWRIELWGRSLSDLCAANQDALIDDLYEDHPGDRPHRAGMIGRIKTYDTLLGTHRAEELGSI